MKKVYSEIYIKGAGSRIDKVSFKKKVRWKKSLYLKLKFAI